MSEVLVGTAYWLAQLRYEQFTQGVSAVEQQIKRLQALSQQPIAFQAQLGAGAGAGAAPQLAAPRSNAPQIDADAQAYDRLQRAQAALEAQQARLARSQGDTTRAAQLEAQAEERLRGVLQAQTSVTTQTIAVERQLASVQQQAARGAVQAAQQQRQAIDSLRQSLQPVQAAPAAAGGGGFLSSVQSAAGVVGIGLGVQQLVRFGESAVTAANSLERTESTVRALSGSQSRYNEVLEVARAGQQAYGGSLESSLRGLGTLVNLSNRAGVSLGTLDNISRRLAIVDPVQGIEGANIALKEFLSGNNAEAALSLARRFELPRQALAALAREGVSAKDRLDGLNRLLNDQGITTQVLTDRTKTQAAIYDRLGAAALNAKDAIGQLLAAQAAPAAGSATGALTGVAQITTAYNELQTKNRDLFNTLQGIINPLQTYNNFVLQQGANLLGWAGATAEATSTTRAHAAAFDEDRQAIGRAQLAQEALTDVEDRRSRQLSINTANAQAAAQAIRDQSKEIDTSAQKSVLDSAAKETQQAKTALMAAQARAATDAFLSLNPKIDESGILALVAAQRLDAETGRLAILRLQAQGATTDLINLNNAQNQAAVNKVVATNRFFGRESGRGGGSDVQAESSALVSSLQKQNQEQQQLLDSEIALAGAKKQTAREIELLRQKQAQYAKGTAEFNQIEAQIIGIQQSAGKVRVSAAQSTALQLQNVEQNSGLQLARIQRENLERLRHQQEEYDVRRSRSEEDYQEKRISLLAHGQRAQAAELEKEHAKEVRRAKEDFDRQKRDTLRNNQEALGDTTNRADLRQQQISNRAALRGVRTAGGVDLGQAPPALSGSTAAAQTAAAMRVIQIMFNATVQMDGHEVGKLIYEAGLREQIDDDLAVSLQQVGIPGSGQAGVGGTG